MKTTLIYSLFSYSNFPTFYDHFGKLKQIFMYSEKLCKLQKYIIKTKVIVYIPDNRKNSLTIERL